MKVKELIEHLLQFDGNLEVYAMTDHGQAPEQVCTPSVIYVEEAGHNLWDEWAHEQDVAAEFGYEVKAVLL